MEKQQDLFMTFVDLTIAFDSVSRNGLWKILAKFGCSEKFVKTVKFLKMKNSRKVTSQIEDIENHFKKKFSPDVSAIHPIQLTPPKTFDRIINIEKFQNAIKKL